VIDPASMTALWTVRLCGTVDRPAVRKRDPLKLLGCHKTLQSLVKCVKAPAEALAQYPELENTFPAIRCVWISGQIVEDFQFDFIGKLIHLIVVLSGHSSGKSTICANSITLKNSEGYH
jgi:hypothetical protein